jgi:hypothetical protein
MAGERKAPLKRCKKITICSIKRKENFFSLFFFSTRTKKQWKKVVSFIGHEVFVFLNDLHPR